MAINNLNPRRTVWFSPYEPHNKYDIWLSKNAHYDENGEPTTDSNAQRDCDYIFKIYDCGKWLPIVGFNSTAKFKINTVANIEYLYTHNGTAYTSSGIQQFHLPLFRDPEDSPAELFDAGTLGDAILQFVSETDWLNIFDSDLFINAFNSHIIEGDSYNWSTLINSNIDFATTSQCGGILSDIHNPEVAAAFKPVEVKFYPTGWQAYENLQHRLCIDTRNVIDLINEYYNDNPGGSTLPINPEQLTIVLDSILKNTSSIGWSILSTSSNPTISPEIYGVTSALAGRYLRIKDPFPEVPASGWTEANCAVEWVDLPEGIEYNAGVGIDINQTDNTISQNIEELEEYQGGLKLLTLLQNQNGSITISDDNIELLTVNPYEIQYLNIPGCQNINITLLKSCTNPVYIYLKTEYDLTIYNSEFDYSGDGLVTDLIKSGNVLITALFGIAKIEYINNFDPNA